jgi:hypothetical protein
MKPTGLGHERVMSPETACARGESSSTELPGKPATAVCLGGVLSGIVVGDGESPLHSDGPDGSTQSAQETRTGQAGSDKHKPTGVPTAEIKKQNIHACVCLMLCLRWQA